MWVVGDGIYDIKSSNPGNAPDDGDDDEYNNDNNL